MKISLLAVLLVLSTSLATQAQESKRNDKSNDGLKVELVKFEIINDEFDMTFTETKREEKYSIAKVRHGMGMSAPASIFIAYGVWKIAKERKSKYFFTAQNDDEDDEEIWTIKAFFFNEKKVPLKRLLGDDYNEEAQEIYDDIGHLSVKQFGFFLKEHDKAFTKDKKQ